MTRLYQILRRLFRRPVQQQSFNAKLLAVHIANTSIRGGMSS